MRTTISDKSTLTATMALTVQSYRGASSGAEDYKSMGDTLRIHLRRASIFASKLEAILSSCKSSQQSTKLSRAHRLAKSLYPLKHDAFSDEPSLLPKSRLGPKRQREFGNDARRLCSQCRAIVCIISFQISGDPSGTLHEEMVKLNRD